MPHPLASQILKSTKMTTMPDGNTLVEDGKPTNDLESAKFTKEKETVDVIQPTAKLIGLTKEQLEQYRNDPFWKAVRYTLFIAFWLVWLLMFIGAILIVVMSPKCREVKFPDKMVAYKMFSLAFKDSDKSADANAGFGDFAGIKEKLGELKEMGVNTIWPSPILTYDKNSLTPDTIVNLDVADQLGGLDKFLELVKAVHTKDMKLIVDLPLTVSSADNWVKQAGNAERIQKNEGKVSALKLTNPTIQKALLELVENFIKWGVDGINLADSGFGESADLAELIKQIHALNGADKIPIFTDKSVGVNNELQYTIASLVGNNKASVKDLVEKLQKNLEIAKEQSKQHMEGENANNTVAQTPPTVWQLGSMETKGNRIDALINDASLSTEQKQQISLLFSLVQLFIPGPTIVLYGEELALPSGNANGDKKANLVVYPWDDSSNYTTGNQFLAVPQQIDNANYASQIKDEHSPLKCFSKVAKLHQHNDFLLGQFNQLAVGGLKMYTVERYPNNTGYYGLIVNWNGKVEELSVAELPNKPSKLTNLASTDKNLATLELAGDVKVKFPAYSALLLQAE